MNIYKKFLEYYKPHKLVFALDMTCAAIASMCDLVIPLLIRYMLDSIESSQSMIMVVRNVCLGLVGLYILRSLCLYYITSYGHIMGAKIEAKMRVDLFEKLQTLPFSYYDKNNTGQMSSRIINDLFDITELAHHGPEDIFISIIKFFGAVIILMNISPLLTCALIFVAIIMGIFSKYYNKKLSKAFFDNRVKIGQINEATQDTLSGIRVVQSFANESIESDKFNKGNELFLKSKRNQYLVMGTYFSSNIFLQGMMYVAIFSCGGYLISKGSLDASDIFVFLLYIGMFLEPINKLVNFTEMFQKGFSGFKRMMEIINVESDIKDTPNAKEITNLSGDIVFSNVTFNYDEDIDILTNISVVIPNGKTFALVGPSGGGKTTFCSLIPRFYNLTSGAIKIGNTNINEYSIKDLRKNIGIVQQDVYIFNTTIKENIGYGNPLASFDEIVKASKKANIYDYIMSLPEGFDTHLGERGVRLSGGQKQRISIARVFLKNPPILILDEATSALDNESEKYIQQSLEELSKNRTTIVIAHRLSTIKNADEILVLTENGIEEKGNHVTLLDKNGLYAKLYNMQFENLV